MYELLRAAFQIVSSDIQNIHLFIQIVYFLTLFKTVHYINDTIHRSFR